MEKIQEILNKELEKYIKKNKVIGYKQKVIKSIMDCKTGAIGGLTEINTRKEKKKDFFIPVKVMLRVFRGKFLSYMRKEKIPTLELIKRTLG